MTNNKDIVSQTEKSLWEVTEMLRSRTEMRHDQVNAVILSFTLIRRIECMLEPCREEMYQAYKDNVNRLDERTMHDLLCGISNSAYFNRTNITLGGIVSSYGSDYISQMSSYMRGFSFNVFDNLRRLQFETLLATLNYNKVLYNVINHFAGIDLSPIAVSNIQLVDVITRFTQPEQNKFAGDSSSPEFFSLIAKALLINNEIKTSTINVYDPTCGTGKMLREVAFKAEQIYSKALGKGNVVHVYGQDINPSSCATTAVMSMLSGGDAHNIVWGDVLKDDALSDKKFQYIVADPPKGLQYSKPFIQHIISKMDPAGSRAAVFTDASALSAGDTRIGDNSIRSWILDKDLVEAIIALPRNVSRYTSAQQYLWILNNNKASDRKGMVRLIDCNRILELEGEHLHEDTDLVNYISTKLYNQDSATCSVQVLNKAFGKYQITLVNSKDKKRHKVLVPMTESVVPYLQTQGYRIEDELQSEYAHDDFGITREEIIWSIDYPSTEAVYMIDFNSFFTTIKAQVRTIDITKKVLPVLDEVSALVMQLRDTKTPETNTDLKETDSDWYGSVPSHWRYSAAGLYLEVVPGRNESAPTSEDDELPYISLSYLRGNSKADRTSSRQKAIASNTLLSDNDVVIVKTGSNSGDVYKGKNGVLSNVLFVVRTTNPEKLDAHFMAYYLKAAEPYLKAHLNGAAIQYLRANTIQEMPIYLPSMGEQKRIVRYLDDICGKIDRLAQLGFNNTDLLQYRKSLNYEAVTGKLELD